MDQSQNRGCGSRSKAQEIKEPLARKILKSWAHYNYRENHARIFFLSTKHPSSTKPLKSAPAPASGTASPMVTIESDLGKTAQKDSQPLQPGDVPATWADVDDLIANTGFSPATPIDKGITEFVKWYREYYHV